MYKFSEIVESVLIDRLTTDKLEELRDVLIKHKVIFLNEPGQTNHVEHDIKLIYEKLIRSKPYCLSKRQTKN